MRSLTSIFKHKDFEVVKNQQICLDISKKLGKLWDLVEAIKVDGGEVTLVSPHPAFHWEARLKKTALLKSLSEHNVRRLNFKRMPK
ncbi:hypothetical protein ACFL6Y_03125 [Elusimicrobiota bacterium]